MKTPVSTLAKNLVNTLVASLLLAAAPERPAMAQSAAAPGRGNDVFASENAIIDTAIPFAIGAREAQQSLRGSFGWPTFQEGLVEGVYFRFDPDGYARFSPNPRLDVDVFEVICKSRTMLCMARKDALSFFLTDRGQLQLRFDAAIAGDRFFVSEGISEIQIPERVLQPLDTQMENLLATGGDLIIRRGGEEIAKVSLRGFVATTAYLRWIVARQDYAVLPRGWPVPNAARRPEGAGVTQASSWNSPMPQPQVVAPAAMLVPAAPAPRADPQAQRIESELGALRRMIADLAEARRPAPEAAAPPRQSLAPDVQRLSEVARQLQAELDLLRQSQAQPAGQPPASLRHEPPQQASAMPPAGAVGPAAGTITGEVAGTPAGTPAGTFNGTFNGTGPYGALAVSPVTAPVTPTVLSPGIPVAVAPAVAPLAATPPLDPARLAPVDPSHLALAPPAEVSGDARGTTRKLGILMEELGLDLKTAVAVLEMSGLGQPAVTPASTSAASLGAATGPGRVAAGGLSAVVSPGVEPALSQAGQQGNLVDQILSELEAEIANAAPLPEPRDRDIPQIREYQLLSQYFRSVALPTLEQLATDR